MAASVDVGHGGLEGNRRIHLEPRHRYRQSGQERHLGAVGQAGQEDQTVGTRLQIEQGEGDGVAQGVCPARLADAFLGVTGEIAVDRVAAVQAVAEAVDATPRPPPHGSPSHIQAPSAPF